MIRNRKISFKSIYKNCILTLVGARFCSEMAITPAFEAGIRGSIPRETKFLCSPMVRISRFHREDRGSIPRIGNANLAQSVERAPFKRVAVGSIPTVGNEMESLDTRYLETDWREIRRLKHSPLWPSGLRRGIQDPLDRKIRTSSNLVGGSKVTRFFNLVTDGGRSVVLEAQHFGRVGLRRGT